MDSTRFDHLTRLLFETSSRRGLVTAFGLVAIAMPIPIAARNKRRHKKKRVKKNAFGCVNVGKFCKNNGQCCSGICQGKKRKKRCKAHNSGGCRPGLWAGVCGGDRALHHQRRPRRHLPDDHREGWLLRRQRPRLYALPHRRRLPRLGWPKRGLHTLWRDGLRNRLRRSTGLGVALARGSVRS